MIRRPPKSTRIYTLFPFTTRFRSVGVVRPEVVHFGLEIRVFRVVHVPVRARGSEHSERGDEPREHEVASFHFRPRSEEHTSELKSLMRNSYAVFCLKKKKHNSDKISTKFKKTNYRHTPTDIY